MSNMMVGPDDEGPSARLVILDLLSADGQATYSVADLIRAGAAFGIGSAGARTAITRLKAEQRLRQVARGLYAIGPEGEPLQHRILGWRTVSARRRDWNGEWLMAVAGPQERADRTVWRRTMRGLELEGFVEAETNLWVRPDNLVDAAVGVRERLAELDTASSLLVVAASGFDTIRRTRFHALWDGKVIAAGHERLRLALDRSRARLDGAEVRAAAAGTLTLGRQAVRRIVRDPLLPDEFCSPDALTGLIAAMDLYDQFGKAVWRRYLAT
ncbi:MAG: hypothetical protein J0H01_37235 [Rhizobiales bacterium]|nr:hypothetical protein [Hyphomicrobiales bacterium]